MSPFSLLVGFVTLGLIYSSSAGAQVTVLRTIPYSELIHSLDETSAHPRWFRLQMPLIGLTFKTYWNTTPEPSYEMLRWPTYDWQIVVASQGPASLSAFNRVKPAIDMDCLATPCHPIIEKSIGLEGRLNLGGMGVVPNNYLFVRRQTVLSPTGNVRRLGFGLGGTLDL
jgi:hypothetical protein